METLLYLEQWDEERFGSLPLAFELAMNRLSAKYRISTREREVLGLIIVYGCTNSEIAEICVISEKTVKNHIANMMKKVNVGSVRKLFSLLFMNMVLDGLMPIKEYDERAVQC